MRTRNTFKTGCAALALLATGLFASQASAQITHFGDVEIDGSLCVGNDCTGSTSFGFDTIVLRENNLRVFFDDTSTAASFPQNDWRLIANASANGGDSYFAIQDATAGRQVFRVFAGARSNALVVDSQGDVGIGTITPATDIEIKIGDTPTVRLQQDGSSGFTPQTWDVAGNEAGFFIRDTTNGSTLPLRIRPGAPSSSIDIEATTGDVGIGSSSPDDNLDVESDAPVIRLSETDTGDAFRMRLQSSLFRMSHADSGATELTLDNLGNMVILGSITTGGGTCGGGCDAVFDPDYDLPSIEEHAELMFANKYLPNVGPTLEGEPINVSDKLGRMLNELEKAHIYIAQQEQEIKRLKALETRVLELEKRLR